ncbi:hypothetical protein ASE01_17135 [Nocardioides sp. Root190]|uniref:HpcH/HpaI aldolase/citrate lyase family protein n=1 Tax=Nocardioides sp. Root190 TaxID=1736488 RepID=UPI0006F46A65|nr:CoA ester lyase [Nocardioides sp. Root190]KRB75086.1 hypothetical protein ASE01_17135 [Nocardioides sp. Root190]
MTPKDQFPRIRSLLLAAGNLPISRKLGRFDADVKVIDLEDGVPDSQKDLGRSMTVETVGFLREEGLLDSLFVRVNAPGSMWIAEDLRAAAGSEIDGIVVPMIRTVAEVREIENGLANLGSPLPILWGIETGWAVENIGAILDHSQNAIGIYFGSEDYATDVGMTRTPGGLELQYARSRIALACANRGIHSADKGVTDIRDDAAFISDAMEGKSYGFTGKICVTPHQAALANTAFAPSDVEVAESLHLLEAYALALADGRSAPEIDGHMIDGPLVVRAQKILKAADIDSPL